MDQVVFFMYSSIFRTAGTACYKSLPCDYIGIMVIFKIKGNKMTKKPQLENEEKKT